MCSLLCLPQLYSTIQIEACKFFLKKELSDVTGAFKSVQHSNVTSPDFIFVFAALLKIIISFHAEKFM